MVGHALHDVIGMGWGMNSRADRSTIARCRLPISLSQARFLLGRFAGYMRRHGAS